MEKLVLTSSNLFVKFKSTIEIDPQIHNYWFHTGRQSLKQRNKPHLMISVKLSSQFCLHQGEESLETSGLKTRQQRIHVQGQ